MKRLVAVILVILLVGSFVFGVWQYADNQRLQRDNTSLKHQLDTQVTQIRNLETQRDQVRAELNVTQNRVAELETKVTALEQNISALEQNITRLQQQFKISNYITVGLTFLWNKQLNINVTTVSAIVQEMNEHIWDKFQVYFFVYYAESRDFMPTTDECRNSSSFSGALAWANAAWNLYPRRDIPVGIFTDINSDEGTVMGCEKDANEQYVVSLEIYSFPGTAESLAPTLTRQEARKLLAHELLHVFAFSDEQMNKAFGECGPLGCYSLTDDIPSAWKQKIQTQARSFQMPVPSS